MTATRETSHLLGFEVAAVPSIAHSYSSALRFIGEFFVTLGLAVSVAGCGDGRPERVPVSGRVLIDGEPLPLGVIQVIPADARVAQGKIGSDGRFELTTYEKGDGCVPGTHSVAVISREILNASAQRWLAPKKYTQPSTSELTVNIDGATDDLVVELTWDGQGPFVERAGGMSESAAAAGGEGAEIAGEE